MSELSNLSRRERQIMDVIFTKGEATATTVLEEMADAPSRTAVRTFLRILEEKGFLKHKKVGREFVFRPTRRRDHAGKSAFHRVLATFFDGSLEKAVAAHLTDPNSEISPEQLKRLSSIIAQARKREE
jgi:BlaI family penicillinase repressor